MRVQAARGVAAARDRHAGRLRVVVDHMPWLRVPAGKQMGEGASLADLVSPLVIEADGTVVPLAHGFARGHAIGNLGAGGLSALADRFRALVRSVAEAAAAATGDHQRARRCIVA